MPLEKRKFDVDLGNIGFNICDFLFRNKDYAFTIQEISMGIEYPNDDILFSTLMSLVFKGILDSKYLDGSIYYTLTDKARQKIEGGV